MGAALGLAGGLFYLLFQSRFYNFDGVACAIAVELGDWPHLVHGNHIAYGAVGRAFFKLWQLLGYQGPAIVALQALDSILGAAGAAIFFSLCRRLGMALPVAAAASIGLGFSYAYWFWSLEPQVYMLGALFMVLALREALADKPDPVRLGLYQGAAVLGHVEHMMFVPAAVYLIGFSKPKLLRYGAALAAVVAAAYAAAAVLVIQPKTLDQWRLWLLGSAALTADRSFEWHGKYSLEGLAAFLRMTFRLIAEHDPMSGVWRALGWVLSILALAAAAYGAKLKPKLGAMAGLWLAFYALLFLSWEPFTMVYRVTDLIPIWLLIALAAASRKQGAVALGAFVALLGHYNGSGPIKLNASAERNAAYQEALWAARNTPEQAWITATAIDQVYLPYFAHRKPLNLRYFQGRPEVLAERLRQLHAAGQPVYVTGHALAQGWAPYFEPFLLKEAAREGDWSLSRVEPRPAAAPKPAVPKPRPPAPNVIKVRGRFMGDEFVANHGVAEKSDYYYITVRQHRKASEDNIQIAVPRLKTGPSQICRLMLNRGIPARIDGNYHLALDLTTARPDRVAGYLKLSIPDRATSVEGRFDLHLPPPAPGWERDTPCH